MVYMIVLVLLTNKTVVFNQLSDHAEQMNFNARHQDHRRLILAELFVSHFHGNVTDISIAKMVPMSLQRVFKQVAVLVILDVITHAVSLKDGFVVSFNAISWKNFS